MLAEIGRAIFFDSDLSEPRGHQLRQLPRSRARVRRRNHGSTIGVPRGSRPGHFARRDHAVGAVPAVRAARFTTAQDERRGASPSAVRRLLLGRPRRLASRAGAAAAAQPRRDEQPRRARASATKIARAPYASDFQRALGAPLDDRRSGAGARSGAALEAFLTSDEMAPFTSKYDDVRARPGDADRRRSRRGLRLFKDPAQGRLRGLPPLDRDVARRPERSLFTDYGYDAVGAPRETARCPRTARRRLRSRPVRAQRRDAPPTRRGRFCVNFRTPSLRNVAVRDAFMHNGAFTNLRDVVAFYATRATAPRRWYRSGVKFDDVPASATAATSTGLAALQPPRRRRRPRSTTGRSTRSSRFWAR